MSRVGVLVQPGRNRDLLVLGLSEEHDVCFPGLDPIEWGSDVDLIITDARALEVAIGSPGFTPPGWAPVLLLVREADRKTVPPQLVAAVDDVATVPIRRGELAARVDKLLARGQREEDDRRAMHNYLAHLNHELRTPLQAVLGFAQLLEQDNLTESQREAVKSITVSGERMLGLVNELLDFAQVESGRLDLKLGAVDIVDVVRKGVLLVSPLYQERDLRLTVEYPDEPAVWVVADQHRLEQVMTNLLSNAVKYNTDGGRLTVRCGADADAAVVEVTDDGPGIPPESMDRIFSPFERLAGTRAVQGTGLGLPLARMLTEQMGGRLRLVRSEPGAGSTFAIRIPRVAAAN